MEDSDSILTFLAAFQSMDWHPSGSPQTADIDAAFKDFVSNWESSKEAKSLTGQIIQFPSELCFRNQLHLAIDPNQIHDARISRLPLAICTPQTDELVQGWLGRLKKNNTVAPNESIEDRVVKFACNREDATSKNTDLCQCIAEILGISRDDLLEQHTLTPFFNALEGLKPNRPGNRSLRHRQAYDRQIPLRLEGNKLRFCHKCAEYERSRHGYSYWHRSHQLPGMLWCPIHGMPLLSTKRSAASDACPHETKAPQADHRLKDLTLSQIAVLKRYGRIAATILDVAPQIDSSRASLMLGKKANEAGLRVSKEGKRPTVSTYLQGILPEWWLRETFPKIRSWGEKEHTWPIDGACSPRATRYTTTTLCVLSALLFKLDDDAIAAALDPQATPKEKRGANYWASREVLDLFISNKGVVNRVAAQLGMPTSTVGIGLLNQGLPGLGNGPSLAQAAHAYLGGASIDEACHTHGIPRIDLESFTRLACARLKTALDGIFGKPAPLGDQRQHGRSA